MNGRHIRSEPIKSIFVVNFQLVKRNSAHALSCMYSKTQFPRFQGDLEFGMNASLNVAFLTQFWTGSGSTLHWTGAQKSPPG